MSLRAMFSSISGLQASSQWLDVIGNNLSNANTVGYKASRVEFADQFSQTLSGGTSDNPSDGSGGIDPLQVGLGTRLASIQANFAEGPAINTGVSTDISIQGDGFFITQQGGQNLLTRAGDLTFDSDGYLVDPEGGRIQGIDATVQYNEKIINSAANGFAQITSANLNLNSNAISSLQSIQINRDMTLGPQATTQVDFKGNLDSLQQPNVLDLAPGFFFGAGVPALPIGVAIGSNLPAANAIDPLRMTIAPTAAGGFTLQQVGNLDSYLPGAFPPPAPLENGFVNLGFIKGFAGDYVWDQQPPVPPAAQAAETVYDSLGNPRQITVQFYQLNDLGADGINNPDGPNQVCYAWYAFDTTGGKPVSTANLLGGTGIGEDDPFFDRGNPNFRYLGDFLWFNTDGSLGSSGGEGGFIGGPGLASNFMVNPRIYLPALNTNPPTSPFPTQGAEIMAVDLDFGTWGLLGQGRRDGLYSDAEGSYKVVNGVNTYVPQNTAYASSQNGYAAGTLQGLTIDETGVIQGDFSNGQKVGLAQIALAQVQNPGGLANVGNNDFNPSPNSGPTQVGAAGTRQFGTVLSGTLEGSNVDLTVELSNMIIAQRGYDTNSRMIAVINETLDVLDHLGEGA